MNNETRVPQCKRCIQWEKYPDDSGYGICHAIALLEIARSVAYFPENIKLLREPVDSAHINFMKRRNRQPNDIYNSQHCVVKVFDPRIAQYADLFQPLGQI